MLTIATRKSQLALWQARFVQQQLQALDQPSQLLEMTSKGDVLLDTPLAKIGGKGLFLKELEQALFDDRADLAVHSMKDVPMSLPDGLTLACICEREDPRDAFVSPDFANLEALPTGAVVGTSSLRRQAQVLAARPDLEVHFLRGNVNSRLAKLHAGQYQAIILAAAGLIRLGLEQHIRQYLPVDLCLPAVGQGAVGIECRSSDTELIQLLQQLNHYPTQLCLTAERAFSKALDGGCQVPIAGFAQLGDQQLQLDVRVGEPDGSLMLISQGQIQLSDDPAADLRQAQQLGQELAQELLAKGAGDILGKLMS